MGERDLPFNIPTTEPGWVWRGMTDWVSVSPTLLSPGRSNPLMGTGQQQAGAELGSPGS